MRPVVRGAAPPNAPTYEAMRPTLLDRLGRYCSYCEYPVQHAAAAEHVVPKKRFPAWRDRWDNLLVTCSHCNGHKGHDLPAPERVDEYLWPVRDNTARAFTYANVVPEVADGLPPDMQALAARLRGLVKLGGVKGQVDERRRARAETLLLAKKYRSHMTTAPNPPLLREAIVDLALARGFFSIWMDVFADDIETRRCLLGAFQGTAMDCFDVATTAAVARPGGRC